MYYTHYFGENVTSAGWQVTLCDPMWHVSSRSGVATLRTAIHLLLYTIAIHLLLITTPRQSYTAIWFTTQSTRQDSTREKLKPCGL